jgi:hypothetical protein
MGREGVTDLTINGDGRDWSLSRHRRFTAGRDADRMNTAADDQPRVPDEPAGSRLSRRQVLTTAGAAGLLATVPVLRGTQRAAASTSAPSDGTPEQIHLTFCADPATTMTVSWALTPGRTRPGRPAWTPRPGTASACSTSTPAVTTATPASTVRYFHAPGADPANPTTGAKGAPNPVYTEFETVKLIRPRSRR